MLQKHFDADKPGNVLELASGTGQHVSYFARHFPKLVFQPSECDESLLDSIVAYGEETPTKNVLPPLKIDVSQDSKTWGLDSKKFDYVININMIHVSPFSCTIGLFRYGTSFLKPGGLLVTYGAYKHNGVITPESNVLFDRDIRRRNPEFGLRDINDVEKIANEYSVDLVKIYDLPANNKCLVWAKRDEKN